MKLDLGEVDFEERRIVTPTRIILAIILLLIVVAVVASLLPTRSSTILPDVPARKVSAETLFKAFNQDGAAAQKAYGDQPLVVSGRIQDVDLELADNPLIMLATGDPARPIKAPLGNSSKGRASSLVRSQSIRLFCTGFSHVEGAPLLNGCELD